MGEKAGRDILLASKRAISSLGALSLILAQGCSLANGLSEDPNAVAPLLPNTTGGVNNVAPPVNSGNNLGWVDNNDNNTLPVNNSGQTNNNQGTTNNQTAGDPLNNGEIGDRCLSDADCVVGVCDEDAALCVGDDCVNGIFDDTEDGLDCGGSCAPCACDGGDGAVVEVETSAGCDASTACGVGGRTVTVTYCDQGSPATTTFVEACTGGALSMICAPSGVFTMGSPSGEPGRDSDEAAHQVTLSDPFLIGASEITQAQWTQFFPLPAGQPSACPECPVVNVSWYEAMAFANQLSLSEGLESCYTLSACQGTVSAGCAGANGCDGDYQCSDVSRRRDCAGYGLPTEAQWEYAARAGVSDARHGEVESISWTNANTAGAPMPVGLKRPNPWGLSDTLGNATEWVIDAYSRTLSSATDPIVMTGDGVVRRGGSFDGAANDARHAARESAPPARRDPDVGLRLSRGP